MYLESPSKAYYRLEDFHKDEEPVFLGGQELLDTFDEKYPRAQECIQLGYHDVQYDRQLKPIEADEVADVIGHMQNSKCPGPSGMTASHLKCVIANVTWLPKFLAEAYNEMLDNADSLGQIPAIFQFRSVFIPKKPENGERKFRPLAINEHLLMVLHKLLKRRLLQRLAGARTPTGSL